jgi:Zn-dependent M28 family amino/carboxypeptidase
MEASRKNLFRHVEFLTELSPARNYRNTATLKKVVDYLVNECRTYGSTPEKQAWKAKGREYENIIVQYDPNKGKRLVVGAHYDVAGDQPGADDNASAVAGLLELIRLTFEQKPDLGFGIDFVAYCLEEPPFFGGDQMGSYIHAKSLNQKRVDVMGMICLEMIGFFSDEPDSQRYPSPELAKIYPSTANFIVVVGIDTHAAFTDQFYKAMAKDSRIDVQVIIFPKGDMLSGMAGLSDQRNYWRFGYPALMVNDTSFVRNPNYHEQSDTIDTLDFEKMTEVVNSVYRGIVTFGLSD